MTASTAEAAPRAPSTARSFGLQHRDGVRRATRYDDIITALNYSYQRQLLTPYIDDHVGEGNAAIYSESTVHWTDWLRTILAGAAIISRHRSIQYCSQRIQETRERPSAARNSEWRWDRSTKPNFLSAPAMGYHSNDARTATVTQVPGDPTTPEGASPLLVRSVGAEVGVRTKAIPNLDSSVSLFYLHQDSELFFDGDTGDTTAGLPSQRTASRSPTNIAWPPGSHIDADLALRAPALSATIRRKRRSTSHWRDIRRHRSVTHPAITSTTRHGWWRPQVSRSAKRPAGSVRYAGATSARGRSPRTASSSRRH